MRIQTGRTCWMSICWLALIGMQANGWFNSGYGNGLLNSIALYTRWCIQGLIMSWQWDTLSTVINLLWLIPTQQKLTTWQTLAVTTPTVEFKTWWPALLLVVQTCHSLVASFCALWRKTRLLPKPVRREVEKPLKSFQLTIYSAFYLVFSAVSRQVAGHRFPLWSKLDLCHTSRLFLLKISWLLMRSNAILKDIGEVVAKRRSVWRLQMWRNEGGASSTTKKPLRLW